MGLFLSMSGVIGAKAPEVVDLLRQYAETKNGALSEAAISFSDQNFLTMVESSGGATILFPNYFSDSYSVSETLSRALEGPVFQLDIHDGDLWMYALYEKGQIIDRFNPVPEYWGELDEKERESWRGNAAIVASKVPGLKPEAIANYLIKWDDSVFLGDEQRKAYPDDQCHVGEDWQIVDFMKRLGLDYPLDGDGNPIGRTYRFKVGK
jgi:hypothetical protein